jgi:ribosomal protein S18 acetylase RimI-like enzyme
VNLDVHEEPLALLVEHARIPIAYLVDSIFDVTIADGGLGGITLSERTVEVPYVKDYDAIRGEGPTRWHERFDVSNWGLIAAFSDAERVGGAVVAFDPSVEGGSDLAILWDIRLVPERRGKGIGRTLFEAAERWSSERGCKQLLVETQNVNVAACRFYAAVGCELRGIDRFAYSEFPDETRLNWRKGI